MLNAKNAMLCWNPGGEVALVPWPDRQQLSRRLGLRYGDLACYKHMHGLSFEGRQAVVLAEAIGADRSGRLRPEEGTRRDARPGGVLRVRAGGCARRGAVMTGECAAMKGMVQRLNLSGCLEAEFQCGPGRFVRS
jgi:hypothetical protein